MAITDNHRMPALDSAKKHVRHVLELAGWRLGRKPPSGKTIYAFRPDPEPVACLSPELLAPVVWPANPDPTAPSGDLAKDFLSTDGCDKWLHYLPIYEKRLAHFRGNSVRFLEIGVARGGSLAAWSRYFGPAATVVGIDINPMCQQYDNPAEGRHVRIGSQDDVVFMRSVVDEFGAFDAILDDGSHMASHMIASFNFLFLHGLTPGGTYLVEDLHAAYWPGYRDRRVSFMELAKGLVDLMHTHYQLANNDFDFRVDSERRRASFTVPVIARLIEGIEFCDSIVVIRKSKDFRELPTTMTKAG